MDREFVAALHGQSLREALQPKIKKYLAKPAADTKCDRTAAFEQSLHDEATVRLPLNSPKAYHSGETRPWEKSVCIAAENRAQVSRLK